MSTERPDASSETTDVAPDLFAALARARAREALFGASTPPRVGRFTLLHRLGAGAMGEVFAAYDPELDRAVAIKILRPDGGPEEPRRRARLTREARAMAKIEHPNVVPIFDVGTTANDQVFIAMALVRGTSLRRWVETHPPWRRVVEVFIDAARGLQAAHDAGVVHRDFKPDNAMLGDDGRVLVMDFGLAQRAPTNADPALTTQHDNEPTREEQTAEGSLTRTGAMVGTPAYMAPEQLRGETVGAAADQYSFCVALFEALFETRPFDAVSVAGLALQQCEHEPSSPPGHEIPREVVAVVLRGLRVEPEQRFGSMDALGKALQSAISPRSKASMGWGAAAMAGVGLLGWYAVSEPQLDPPCSGADAAWQQVWNDETRDALAHAFDPAASPFRATTFGRVQAALERYGDRFRSAHERACRANRVEGAWSDRQLDAAMACLDDRADRITAFLSAVDRFDDDAVTAALDTIGALPAPEPCDDAGYLEATVAPPDDPRTVELVRTLRGELAKADAAGELGQTQQARDDLEGLATRVEEAGYPPLSAEYLLQRGRTHLARMETAEAHADLSEAYFLAREHGHHEAAMQAAMHLVEAAGVFESDIPEAELWLRHARADAIAADVLDEVQPALLSLAGSIAYNAGRNEESQAFNAEAVELQRRVCESCPDFTSLLSNLASAENALGNQQVAIAHYREVLRLDRQFYGDDHPEVAAGLLNLANALDNVGAYREALEAEERALEIRTAVFGREHRMRARVLSAMAATLLDLGRTQDAVKTAEEAVRIFEHSAGPTHTRTANAMNSLAWILDEAGELDRAQDYYARALRIVEAQPEPSPVAIAAMRNNLASVLIRAERFEEAEAILRASIEQREQSNGAEDPGLAPSLLNLAWVLEHTDRVDEAASVLERCVVVARADAVPQAQWAMVRLRLADALADTRPRRARVLAREARDVYAELGAKASLERADALLVRLGGDDRNP